MILKLIYILCLLFSALVLFVLAFYENLYASKADSTLSTEQFLPLKDVAVSDALMAWQKDNASPKIVKNIYNDSSNILNASSSVSELTPQTYPGNKSIGIEKENKIASHHEHPALASVTSTIYKSTDFLLFENETLVGKYRPMNSTKFDDVNQTRDTGKVAPSNSTKNFDTMKATSTRAQALHRMARADKESVQTVLKKIFPDRFFPKKSNSDFYESRNVNNRNNNSPRRRQKVKKLGAGRFGGESVYFRENAATTSGTETAASTTSAEGTTAHETSAAESSTTGTTASETSEKETTASETSDKETGGTVTTSASTQGATGKSQTGVSSGKQVNYHYHFHYFGGLAAPTLPGGAASTTAQSPK